MLQAIYIYFADFPTLTEKSVSLLIFHDKIFTSCGLTDRRHIYTFVNRCLENLSLALGDETTKIFLSTKGEMDDVDAEMKEFLAYIENSTNAFAAQAASPLVKEIHKRVPEVKQNKDMEVECMTLLQRDREKREEGSISAIKVLKLHNKGMDNEGISSSLQLDLEYVNSVISDYEND